MLGTFDVPNTGGWQKYTWVPVKNSNGNLVYFTGGGVKTLRYTVNSGGHNPGFFMLLPADLSQLPPPSVSDFKPDGTTIFQFTNQLSFKANSFVGMTAENIVVKLDGVSVNDLTISGTPNLWKVSCPVKTNALHTIVITLTDSAGSSTITNRFETFDANNITFEAEDFNYDNGQFFDNPTIGQYAWLDGVKGVDFNGGSQGANAYNRVGPSAEGCGDVLRPGWASGQDFDIGWNDGGNWANYIRTFPAGIYNVFIRAGSPGGSTDSIRLSRVTSDPKLPDQTTSSLGTFSFPASGGWQTYTWVPLKDASGNMAQVVTDGSATTFRETVGGGGGNVNFYMLVPASSDQPASIGSFQPDGSRLFQLTNRMTFTVTSPAGVSTDSIVVTVDGAVVTNLTFSGYSNVWNVVCPVATNATHTILVTVTDANGTISSTYSLTTYNGANYQ